MPLRQRFSITPPAPLRQRFDVNTPPLRQRFDITGAAPLRQRFSVGGVPLRQRFTVPAPATPETTTIAVACALNASATVTITVGEDWTIYEPLTVLLTGAAGEVATEVVTDEDATTVTAGLPSDDVWTVSITADDGTALLFVSFPTLCHGYACFREENRAVEARGGDVTRRWEGIKARLDVIPALVADNDNANALLHLALLQETCAQSPDCGCSC